MTEKIEAIRREYLYTATITSTQLCASGCIFFFYLHTYNHDGLTLFLSKVHLHFFVGAHPPCLPKNYFSSNFLSLICIIHLLLF